MSRETMVTAFTAAESRILQHLRDGLCDAEIAVRLEMSVSALKARIESMVERTGSRSRAELLKTAAA